jgi:DNA-binding transcriptional MerR regulator
MKPLKRKTISAKEIVKKYGIRYHTLNYYAAIGLLPVAGKIGNERVFEQFQVSRRLAKISKMSKEGYPLHLIRKKIMGF